MDLDAQNIFSATASFTPYPQHDTSPRPPSAPGAIRHGALVALLATALAATHCVTSETSPPVSDVAPTSGSGAVALFARRVRSKVRIVYTLPSTFRGRGLVAQLGLRIAADGKLRDVVVTRASGEPGFDALLLDAAQRASPFPEPPADVLANDGLVTIAFEAN